VHRRIARTLLSAKGLATAPDRETRRRPIYKEERGARNLCRSRRPPLLCVIRVPGLLPAARIVLRIDVVELEGRRAVDLHYGLPTSHGEVVHIGIEKAETPVGQSIHICCLENITHSQLESPLNNGHIFPERMKVRRDAVSIRHL